MSRTRQRVVWLALAAVAVAALAVFGLAGSKSAKSGRLAPELPRETLSGQAVTLSSALAAAGERPVMVVFWASWCDPCIEEAPAVERFAESAAGKGRIVGVNWSDPELAEAHKFIKRYAWTFPNLRDGEGKVGNEYRLANLPNWFVIDKDHRIREVLIGPQTQSSLETALRRVGDS